MLITKLIYKVIGLFIKKKWWGMTLDMHKRAFQGLKRMFMHVTGIPHHVLKKKQILYKLFFEIKVWWVKT